MDNQILSALDAISPDVTYPEWLDVGMALKEEGFPVSVWEDWSRRGSKFVEGECARKWTGFHGHSNPVKGGTIIELAKASGWTYTWDKADTVLGWDHCVSVDDPPTRGAGVTTLSPCEQFTLYLKALFKDDEHVRFVVKAMSKKDSEGKEKWVPANKGVLRHTAGSLIASLKKHPDDLGSTIGDWTPEAGAWISFNPMDGQDAKDANVTSYRYALYESDDPTMSMSKQYELIRKLNLPVVALVRSGGKSLHAIVHIDADNLEQWKGRVKRLFDVIEEAGGKPDRANINPSRLSRLPGVTRGDRMQTLEATNIGCPSYGEWLEWYTEKENPLPPMVKLSDKLANPDPIPEPLIDGVLRCGHKMLIAGPSKAGKSFLLMQLAICIAEGKPWLGFPCKQGPVIYINLEIDPASCIERFRVIYQAMGIEPKHADEIIVWNLRGHALPLNKLVPKLIQRYRAEHVNAMAVTVDPIYKTITGDENKASDMGAFCNLFDQICSELGCAAVYCHHHSKGAQGAKKASDRASGSGVFARDPDAQIDITPLQCNANGEVFDFDSYVEEEGDKGIPMRIEGSLREFKNFKPVNCWYKHPLYVVDESGELDGAMVEGSQKANRAVRTTDTKKENTERWDKKFKKAYDKFKATNPDEQPNIQYFADVVGGSKRNIQGRLDSSNMFYRKDGKVYMTEQPEAENKETDSDDDLLA